MVPALTLYFTEKYDLGATHLPDSFHKVNLLQAIKILATTQAHVLEVPEPLWMRFLPKNVVLLVAWRLSGLLRRRRQLAVTYAIENNDLTSLLSPRMRLPPLVLHMAGSVLGRLIRSLVDRVAFGSAGSMALYHSLAGVRQIRHRLIEELPASSGSTSSQDRRRVIFVGELDDRKGILDVVAAWPSVESAIPDAVLTIVGGGAYSDQVSRWCSERPATRVFLGFLAHGDVIRALRHADVLVAPSRRSGRWREQIGLPIAEALAHGLTVVTTSETGLASWLADNGHRVIEEQHVPLKLGEAIVSALQNQLRPASIGDSLPSIPGRIASDKWLHTP